MKTGIVITLLLVLSSFSAYAGEGNQIITFQLEDSLYLTTPADLGLTLDVGETNISEDQPVIVECNTSYGIRIKCDTVSASQMREFDGTDYVTDSPEVLNTVMQFKEKDAASYTDIATTDQVITSGAPAPGDTHYVNFNQPIGYGDSLLTGGNTYHMIITYTAVEGW